MKTSREMPDSEPVAPMTEVDRLDIQRRQLEEELARVHELLRQALEEIAPFHMGQDVEARVKMPGKGTAWRACRIVQINVPIPVYYESGPSAGERRGYSYSVQPILKDGSLGATYGLYGNDIRLAVQHHDGTTTV